MTESDEKIGKYINLAVARTAIVMDEHAQKPKLTGEVLHAIVSRFRSDKEVLQFAVDHPNILPKTLDLAARFIDPKEGSLSYEAVAANKNTSQDTLYYLLVRGKSADLTDHIGMIPIVASRVDLSELVQDKLITEYIAPNITLISKRPSKKAAAVLRRDDTEHTVARRMIETDSQEWVHDHLVDTMSKFALNAAITPANFLKLTQGSIALGNELIQVNLLSNERITMEPKNPMIKEALQLLKKDGASEYVQKSADAKLASINRVGLSRSR